MRISTLKQICVCGNRLENYSPVKIEKILDSWPSDKEKLLPFRNELVREMAKNWDTIRQNQLLTWYLIDELYITRLKMEEKSLVHRENADARSGGIFEDKFGLLLQCYLEALDDFWDGSKNFRFEILINPALIIPGEPRKNHPDILISDITQKSPVMVLELKVSYND
jgi:hypothetical protein